MRKMMIFGAAIAALLISAIPAEAGCGGGGAGLFGGLFGGRRAARQAAAGGDCYSAQYASYSAYSSTCAAPQMATVGYGYTATAPCPTGNCPPQVASYSPPRAVQYVYTQAPSPVITSTPQIASTCDANGDGRCDHCGMDCTAATRALPQAPPTPPPAPTPLSRQSVKPAVRVAAIRPPDPVAPPIAYMPPAPATETVIAFR